jgi:hypothetical protein
MSTHVPCFPVKPWKSTLVSPLIRRFLIVSAYCEEPVAYCRVAALESAERMGFRRACIVAVGCHEGRAGCTEEYRGLRRGGAGFERAGSCDTFAGILRLQLGLSQIHRQGPVRARQPHENTSSINLNSAHQKAYVRATRTMVCRKEDALRDDNVQSADLPFSLSTTLAPANDQRTNRRPV